MRFILSGGYIMGGDEVNFLYRRKRSFMRVGEKFVLGMHYCTCTGINRVDGDYHFRFKVGRKIAAKKWFAYFDERRARRRRGQRSRRSKIDTAQTRAKIMALKIQGRW